MGVIDLGTNTFHLLIGVSDGTGMKIHHRKRIHVRLGRSGMDHIPANAHRAALSACRHFRNALDDRSVSRTLVLGTAVLRQARNAQALIRDMESVLREPVHVIDGKTEATLIALGAMMPLKPSRESRLLIDIGGGSVEFILFRQNQPVWSRSFNVGVAELKDRFHRTDPISSAEIGSLRHFPDDTLQELLHHTREEASVEIVGAAGVFEVLAKVIGEPISRGIKAIPLCRLTPLTEQILAMGCKERSADPRIPRQRSAHMVVALLLIEWLLTRVPATGIIHSPFSLKEGALLSCGLGLNQPWSPSSSCRE